MAIFRKRNGSRNNAIDHGWARYKARKQIAFTLLSMLLVSVTTLWALVSMVIETFSQANGFDIKFINGMASLTLIGLAIYRVVVDLIKLRIDLASKDELTMAKV